MADETMDLFGGTESGETGAASVKLDVVRMEYAGAESLSWEELFDGFDDIRAITFSSGVGFVSKLLARFATAEIIFGCEDVMSGTLQDVMAYQSMLIDRLRKNESKTERALIGRIEAGTLKLFVARKQLSHEKIYLLSAADGRRRVVMGSANMSYNAFGGRQRENICYVDGDAAYDWYLGCYEDLKKSSVDEITRKSLDIADAAENADALPISETVKVKKAIYIEPAKELDEVVRFILDTRNLSKQLAPSLPAIVKPDKKTGRVLVVPDAIVKIRRQIVNGRNEEKVRRNEYPQLNVNVEERKVTLNGRLDTSTAPEMEKKLSSLEGVTALELDFSGLEYISSAGLRVLLAIQKVMNKQGSMVLHNVNESVREVFDITGFSDILTIE